MRLGEVVGIRCSAIAGDPQRPLPADTENSSAFSEHKTAAAGIERPAPLRGRSAQAIETCEYQLGERIVPACKNPSGSTRADHLPCHPQSIGSGSTGIGNNPHRCPDAQTAQRIQHRHLGRISPHPFRSPGKVAPGPERPEKIFADIHGTAGCPDDHCIGQKPRGGRESFLRCDKKHLSSPGPPSGRGMDGRSPDRDLCGHFACGLRMATGHRKQPNRTNPVTPPTHTGRNPTHVCPDGAYTSDARNSNVFHRITGASVELAGTSALLESVALPMLTSSTVSTSTTAGAGEGVGSGVGVGHGATTSSQR